MQPNGRMYEIYFEGGGEKPQSLSGSYTSKRVANADIEAYLTKRAKPNATTKKASRAK